MKLTTFLTVLVGTLALVLVGGTSAMGAFSVGYSDGGSWNSIYAQGFSPSVEPTPDPSLLPGHQVSLNSFSFFRSGNANSAANVRLAIISPFFSNIFGMSTTSPYVVGLSDNTVDPNSIATGDPISFSFGGGLPLTYGNGYAAVYVNVSGTDLIPVLVPSLVADYIADPNSDPNSPVFIPETNYGTNSQFDYAVSNFYTTTNLPPPPTRFFNTFSFAADANFLASFSVIPEPATLSLGMAAIVWSVASRRRRRS